ncbi:unnamed protein product [Heterobilharzia americana]|nr:unnamed protein product [Heterobilharzia americana]CAH8616920.1 unnamed protein product [Heterobilharzia americana]
MVMRYIWLIWCILTWTAAILCITGFLLPYWLDGRIYSNEEIILEQKHSLRYSDYSDLPSTLNLFRRCVYPVYTGLVTDILLEDPAKAAIFLNQPPTHRLDLKQASIESSLVQIQTNCGYYQFFDIPHAAWRFSLILLGISCCFLFFLAFFLSFTGCYLNFLWQFNVHRVCQTGLLISGLIILLSCILFPIGWSNNDEIVQICGQRSSRFDLGHCQLGWAYVITIMSGLLSVFCAVLPNLCFPRILRELKQQKSQYMITNQGQASEMIPHILSHDITAAAAAATQGPPSIETASTSLHMSDPRIHRIGFESPWLKNWSCLNPTGQGQPHGPMVFLHPDYNLQPRGVGYTDNQLGYSQGSLDDGSSVGTEKKSVCAMKSSASENKLQNTENSKITSNNNDNNNAN